MMLADVVLRQRQAEPAAGALAGKIRVKDPGEMGVGDAFPLIFKGYLHISAGRQGQPVMGGNLDISGPDGQDAAAWHGLAGIDDQILRHLAELPLVDFKGPQPVGQIILAPDI